LSSSTLLMESFQCWDCPTPTLQVWSNPSYSMEICWFVLFHSIWTLSNLSNVPILLECYWENNTHPNWECVIEWVIQFVLEVMWFYCLKVRDEEVKEVDTQLRSVCHFVSLSNWVRDEEEMLTLSLRMEVDSVRDCKITKEFEVMSIWRLFHSIHWFHIHSIQDVEVLSMCRLDSICHSNLVSIAHSTWYMFEFDCVMMLLYLYSHSHFVGQIQIQIQSIWKCEGVSMLRLSLEFHFHLSSFSKWEWALDSLEKFTLFNTFFKIFLLNWIQFNQKWINQLSSCQK
jgi:hypothetical protein